MTSPRLWTRQQLFERAGNTGEDDDWQTVRFAIIDLAEHIDSQFDFIKYVARGAQAELGLKVEKPMSGSEPETP